MGKKSENLADSMASFVQSTVTDIGTVDPENDFLTLLDDGGPFDKCKFAFIVQFLIISPTQLRSQFN